MERRIYLDELEDWAQRELGRPMPLIVRKLPWNVNGVAWTDLEGNACIALSDRLRGHPNAVMSTFYHEVAHHKQGDCWRREPDPTLEAMATSGGISYEEYVNLPREQKANAGAGQYIRGESAPYTPGTAAPKATAAPGHANPHFYLSKENAQHGLTCAATKHAGNTPGNGQSHLAGAGQGRSRSAPSVDGGAAQQAGRHAQQPGA